MIRGLIAGSAVVWLGMQSMAWAATPGLDWALQTAMDFGKSIGATIACGQVEQPRIDRALTQFQSAIEDTTKDPGEVALIREGFEQGKLAGRSSVSEKATACPTAARDFERWTVAPISLKVPTVGSATPATPALPPVVAAAPAPAASPPPPPASPPPAVAAKSALPAVRGVTDTSIRLGIVAPFSGPTKELGRQMRLGIEAAFGAANEAGGIEGRRLVLVSADDGYDPARTEAAMKHLLETEHVFGFIGNVGTPTTQVALPYALSNRALFFGAFTGAPLLRRDPPDRYVFNYRASYAEETAAVMNYLVKVRRLKPEQIAVFAQQDGYGDAGFEGVVKAVRSLAPNLDTTQVPRLGYQRNTVDVDGAVNQLAQYQKQRAASPIKAVVMVATYRAAARFIDRTQDVAPGLIYTNVSFVGSTALAEELRVLGPKYANGVIVTQVVPPVEGFASVVIRYKEALAKSAPGEAPDYVSLEGYLEANLLIEALRRAGSAVDTEKLVNTLEKLSQFDLGVGVPVSLSAMDHQALHKVWGTQLDANGKYQPLDLE